jgi:hypothetical protein
MDAASWAVEGHFLSLINAREKEMGYSPCFPHSISFSFFIFTDIIVVVVGVFVVIKGRWVRILSHGTSS